MSYVEDNKQINPKSQQASAPAIQAHPRHGGEARNQAALILPEKRHNLGSSLIQSTATKCYFYWRQGITESIPPTSRMAQQNVMALPNTGEDSEDRSRAIAQASSSQPFYTAGQSSGVFAGNSTGASLSSSSLYYSTRIYNMVQNRSNFTSQVEFDIAFSKDHHWSDLVDSDTDNASTRLGNREYFQVLKNHPQWGGFFTSVKVVVGQKINEGAQAEIYDAKVEFEDGRKSPGYGYHVVKVMKGDNPLQDFQRQWPVGMLCSASAARVKGPLMWILGGTMIDNRFAFVMVKQWGDLRKLIDDRMQLELNRRRPDFKREFVIEVLLCIARDMEALHTKYGIVHRDLKASNILLWSLGEGLPCDNPHVKANVVDYECSMGVVGSRFWRAPEILQQLKDKVPSSKIVFTKAADVYSYGMICYELITGRIPFEELSTRDFDIVLSEGTNRLLLSLGPNPLLSEGTNPGLEFIAFVEMKFWEKIMVKCWNRDPSVRPTFTEITKTLERFSKKLE